MSYNLRDLLEAINNYSVSNFNITSVDFMLFFSLLEFPELAKENLLVVLSSLDEWDLLSPDLLQKYCSNLLPSYKKIALITNDYTFSNFPEYI